MPGPLELKGTPASPGYRRRPALPPRRAIAARYADQGDRPQRRAQRSKRRSQRRSAQLERADRGDRPARRPTSWNSRLAMLDDDALTGPAFAAIAAGAPADAAWRAALDARDRRLRSVRRRLFPRPRRRPDRHPRPRAARTDLAGRRGQRAPPGAILVGEDITPTRFLETDWTAGGGIALADGQRRRATSPCWRARAACRWSSASARRRSTAMPRRWSTPSMAASCSARPTREHRALPQIVDAPTRERREQRRRAILASRPRPPTARAIARAWSTSPTRPTSTRIDVATCDGVGLMRTEFLFAATALPDEETQYRAYAQGARMGGGQAGDDPHPRCRRRQAGAGLHRRGEQPVPRPARHPPVAGAAGGLPRAAPGAAARRGARQSQDHAADGHRAGRVSRAAALFDEEAGRACRAQASPHAARRSASWSRCRPWRSRRSASPTSPSSRSARTT